MIRQVEPSLLPLTVHGYWRRKASIKRIGVPAYGVVEAEANTAGRLTQVNRRGVRMLVYKLRKTILAVNYEGSQPVAITLSEGKVLTVPNNFTDLTGLIDIECEGKNMRLFAADLRDRGELVKAATQP